MTDKLPAEQASFRQPLRPWERQDFVARPSFSIHMGHDDSNASIGWAVFETARLQGSGELPLQPGTHEQNVAQSVTAIINKVGSAAGPSEVGSPEIQLFTYDRRTFPSSHAAADGMTLAQHTRQVNDVAAELRRRGYEVRLRRAAG